MCDSPGRSLRLKWLRSFVAHPVRVLTSIGSQAGDGLSKQKITMRSLLSTREDMRRSVAPTVRGSLIGSIIGVLPGSGTTVAAFMAYAAENLRRALLISGGDVSIFWSRPLSATILLLCFALILYPIVMALLGRTRVQAALEE